MTTTERFALPEQLPATVDELNALLTSALAQINLIQARARADEVLSPDDVTYLREMITARNTLRAEIETVQAAETAHREELASLLEQAADTPAQATSSEDEQEEAPSPPAPDTPPDVAAAAEQAAPEVLEITPEMVDTTTTTPTGGNPPTSQLAPVPGANQSPPSTGGNRPVNFSGLDTHQAPVSPAGPGWRMKLGAPGFEEAHGQAVGFSHIGEALASRIKGTRKTHPQNTQTRGSFMAQVIADLKRDVQLVDDPHQLVTAIENATRTVPTGRGSLERVPLTTQSLVAAGGWCSPSEVLYDFCDVPDASDLISIPEITIVRGGVRWPVEPDLSTIFENFEFFYTEPELEAVGADNFPVARKECVDIPCPTEFEEMRLSVVGYCVEAGILQTQGWPELITWFTQSLVAEHLRAISRRTILDMVLGSTLEVFSSAYLIGTIGAVLNAASLMATNLRLNRGLSRTAPVEIVAPSWLFEAMRGDAVYYGDMYAPALSDAQIHQWFAERNISIQLVGDWQTRDTGEPGNLGTTVWPGYVDLLVYPAGTWFRAMQNVIELGVMYPKEELVLNRYTRMFTEDAIAVGSRCYPSLVVRVPINVNGGVGARYTLTAPSFTVSQGVMHTGAPVVGGPEDFTQGNIYSLTPSGTITSGTFVLTLTPTGGIGQNTAALPFNATADQLSEAFEGMFGFTEDDIFVTSSTAGEVDGGALPADTMDITVPMGYSLSVASQSLSGGSVAVALVSTGTGTD